MKKASKYRVVNEQVRDEIWSTKSDRPEWVHDMVYAAHNGMLPDDWKYATVVESLRALAEYEDTDQARESIEADIYTADLLKWLSSSLRRLEYCDEAARELGIESEALMFERIQYGQHWEQDEMFGYVLSALENMVTHD